jgi:hypothetical protein
MPPEVFPVGRGGEAGVPVAGITPLALPTLCRMLCVVDEADPAEAAELLRLDLAISSLRFQAASSASRLWISISSTSA